MSARRPSAPKLARAYVREMLAAGLKVGEFDVRVVGDEVTILTHPAVPGVASEADEESAWGTANGKWRRSA